MTRGDKAKNNFLSGYNCSQAVAFAFADLLDVPEETLKAVFLPMGGGMGRGDDGGLALSRSEQKRNVCARAGNRKAVCRKKREL